VTPRPTIGDQTVGPQKREVLRDPGVADAERILKRVYITFSCTKLVDDMEPLGMRQYPKVTR
jgi:hypothetical protein